jgi:predicted nucleotidyltransferase
LEPSDRADAYFGLLHGLEDVFGRKIDLVTNQAISNPWFRRAVDRQRTVLYAA